MNLTQQSLLCSIQKARAGLEKYGNLGSGKAAQRARNTKMNKQKVQTDKNTVVIDR
jgi:hypothetical protein